eukprot:GHVL01021575.1.p1 GENE.GHVL01021575.1~~GHVL01021575.1.p1  ORF type:complete len:152 (+),score=61.69 GHVL01021575.1:96-551(+)
MGIGYFKVPGLHTIEREYNINNSPYSPHPAPPRDVKSGRPDLPIDSGRHNSPPPPPRGPPSPPQPPGSPPPQPPGSPPPQPPGSPPPQPPGSPPPLPRGPPPPTDNFQLSSPRGVMSPRGESQYSPPSPPSQPKWPYMVEGRPSDPWGRVS